LTDYISFDLPDEFSIIKATKEAEEENLRIKSGFEDRAITVFRSMRNYPVTPNQAS